MAVNYGWCEIAKRPHEWNDFVLNTGGLFKNAHHTCRYCKKKLKEEK